MHVILSRFEINCKEKILKFFIGFSDLRDRTINDEYATLRKKLGK